MSSDTESECAICLETLEPETFYRFNCSHRLHQDCFKQYVQYKYDIENNSLLCPICKQDIEVKPIRDYKTLVCASVSVTLVTSAVFLAKYLT